MVKGISSPKLLGIPSGTGLQKYAGIRVPLVNACVGATDASASNDIARKDIMRSSQVNNSYIYSKRKAGVNR